MMTTSRIQFGPAFLVAIQVRGMTLDEVAHLAGVSRPTVCAAVRGGKVNLSTARRIAEAVSAQPVIPELESWVDKGLSSAQPIDTISSMSYRHDMLATERRVKERK